MRRAILALIGTATGTVLLVGAKAGPATGATPAARVAGQASVPTGTAPSRTGPTSRPAPTASTKRPHTAYLQDGSWPGGAVHTDYGDVSLQITVANKKITDVVALAYPNDRSESQRISGNAVKKLRAEALAAQSATIRSVSGASETSAAYKTSLQAAIDAAHGA